jgi:hypothetical protein
LSYYLFQSSRAARFYTTASGLLKLCITTHPILRAPRRFYTTSSKSLNRCGAGWQPAADWQSACRDLLVISQADGCAFAACRYVGRVGKTCGRLSKSACRYHPKSSQRQWLSFAACRFAGPDGNRMASCAAVAYRRCHCILAKRPKSEAKLAKNHSRRRHLVKNSYETPRNLCVSAPQRQKESRHLSPLFST